MWKDRPSIPNKPLFLHPTQYAGRSAAERIAEVRTRLASQGANATIITMIDELAWVFNIRGYDVAYNPVGVGFGYIGAKEAVLFVLPEKVTRKHLRMRAASSVWAARVMSPRTRSEE